MKLISLVHVLEAREIGFYADDPKMSYRMLEANRFFVGTGRSLKEPQIQVSYFVSESVWHPVIGRTICIGALAMYDTELLCFIPIVSTLSSLSYLKLPEHNTIDQGIHK